MQSEPEAKAPAFVIDERDLPERVKLGIKHPMLLVPGAMLIDDTGLMEVIHSTPHHTAMIGERIIEGALIVCLHAEGHWKLKCCNWEKVLVQHAFNRMRQDLHSETRQPGYMTMEAQLGCVIVELYLGFEGDWSKAVAHLKASYTRAQQMAAELGPVPPKPTLQ